jgi:hypothetical protein
LNTIGFPNSTSSNVSPDSLVIRRACVANYYTILRVGNNYCSKERVNFRLLIAGDHTWTMDQNGMTDVIGTPQSLAAWLMGREPDDKLVTSDGSPLGKPPLWL